MPLFRDAVIGSETSQENEDYFPEEMEEMGTAKPTTLCPQIRCPYGLPLSKPAMKLGLAELILARRIHFPWEPGTVSTAETTFFPLAL